MLIGGHRSLPGSSASSRRTPTGSTESRGKYQISPIGLVHNARPVPAPQPGPLLIEVTLLRGTRSGLGFSIAGGVGNETVDGDPGIFVTKVIVDQRGFTIFYNSSKNSQVYSYCQHPAYY